MSTLTPTAERVQDEVVALSRGIAVLRCIARANEPLGNRSLSDLTGVPRATVSRLTATLVSLGMLRQCEQTERFSLAAGVLEFSGAYLAGLDLNSVAQPHLVALAERSGAGVLLGACDRLEMVVLQSVRPRAAMVLGRVEVGGRLSLASSALGRAYLAMLAPPERDRLLASVRLSMPEEWQRAEAGLITALAQAQAEGFCLSLGEWHPELNTIGCAFALPSGDVYGVTCGGSPVTQTRERLMTHVAPALRQCVERIAAELGGRTLTP